MRLTLAFATAFVGLSTLSVCPGLAQPSSVWEKLRDANPHDLLTGPTQTGRKSDDIRNLSVEPSTAPADAADARGAGREFSSAERQQLLQDQTRPSPPEWGPSGDRD
jgi:hypothetical protein